MSNVVTIGGFRKEALGFELVTDKEAQLYRQQERDTAVRDFMDALWRVNRITDLSLGERCSLLNARSLLDGILRDAESSR